MRELVVSGDGADPSGPGWRVDDGHALWLTPAGLVISDAHSPWTEPPTLVAWAHLRGFSAERIVRLPEGERQVLEVVVDDDSYGRAGQVRRFAVGAADLAGFFGAVAGWSRHWSAAVEAVDTRSVPVGSASTTGLVAAMVATTVAAMAIVAAAAGRGWTRLADWSGLTRRGAHGRSDRRRLGPAGAALAVLVLVGAGAVPVRVAEAGTHPLPPTAPSGGGDVGLSNLARIAGSKPVSLPKATTAPKPAPPSLAGSAPLRPHEVFGYAPYWTLPESSGFDVADLTTLAYFSVDANGDGTIDHSGSGWDGYQSQDLVNLIDRSHAAGDRVVLTVTCFSQSALDQITSDPAAAKQLASSVIALISAKDLDGVNFDFEGEGSGDRAGLTALITSVSAAIRGANPHWQVTMATYASAAADSGGFYDIAALAPAVDAFFVMAYDMNDPVTPSATAPLVGGGYNDTETVQQYTAVVPAKKVLLGVPYYGYDWPTVNGTLGAPSTGSDTPLSFGTIEASGHPTYWDPSTQTAWTSYQVGTQWRETFFDNPTSLALKAQLANSYGIAGTGIWALGMDGNDPDMLSALVGKSPPVKDLSTGPTATAPSGTTVTTGSPAATGTVAVPGTTGTTGSTTPGSTSTTGPPSKGGGGLPGTGFTSTGQFDGQKVPLTPTAVPDFGAVGANLMGVLMGFHSTDPALACLSSGPEPTVWSISSAPGVYVVVAEQPSQCVNAAFTFPIPASGGGGTTTTTVAPTTTTTQSGGSTTTSSSSTSTSAPPDTSTSTTGTSP